MLKNEMKEKKNENFKIAEKKIRLKKYNLKNTTKTMQKKGERPKKGVGERGGGAHIKNMCPEFLPESLVFSS